MSTDTRSVAEIVGAGYTYVTYPCMKGQVKSARWMDGTYTADDLLAWLSASVIDVDHNQCGEVLMHYEQGSVFVSWYTPHGMDDAEGPTLLAALEAAVRAVAGES